jgi:hypothetical protein
VHHWRFPLALVPHLPTLSLPSIHFFTFLTAFVFILTLISLP